MGQIAVVPTESWRGNTYQIGSVEQIVSFLIHKAQSLWAQVGGSPSANSTAGRPWYFALSFQNDFTFTPEYPNAPTTDISYLVATIKAAALKEFKAAYSSKQVNVNPFEGTQGDVVATVLNHETLPSNVPDCGVSQLQNNGVWAHQVDYAMNMFGAQDAYQVVINNVQDERNVLANRFDMIRAIGRGLGVSAAHEVAHQFVDSVGPLGAPGLMDADPSTDSNPRGTFNAGGCDGHWPPNGDPSSWLGYWPANPPIYLHWEAPSLLQLGEALGGGWHKR